MALIDVRKKSEAEQSFYVVDDLRYQQNSIRQGRGSFDIYRFDTLPEAIEKFREIPEDMTPAIGMHMSERSELDLVHRRNGESVLVTDYLNFPRWRTDCNVFDAIKELGDALNIEWQMNSKLIPGGTILIPYERNFERVPDRVFDNKNLAATKPTIYSNTPKPFSAINEAFAEGHGWISSSKLKKAAEDFGYQNPELLKVKQFNINYIDNKGSIGQADISPYDLEILEERHSILFGSEQERSSALRKLAEELDEFGEDFDYYDYHDGIEDREEHIESLIATFSEGKVDEIVSYLRDVAEENEEFSDRALNLTSRIQGLVATERKPALDSKINDAAERSGQNYKDGSEKDWER